MALMVITWEKVVIPLSVPVGCTEHLIRVLKQNHYYRCRYARDGFELYHVVLQTHPATRNVPIIVILPKTRRLTASERMKQGQMPPPLSRLPQFYYTCDSSRRRLNLWILPALALHAIQFQIRKNLGTPISSFQFEFNKLRCWYQWVRRHKLSSYP